MPTVGAEYKLYAGRQNFFIAHSRRLRKVEKVYANPREWLTILRSDSVCIAGGWDLQDIFIPPSGTADHPICSSSAREVRKNMREPEYMSPCF